MTDQNKTAVLFIIDRSGSMMTLQSDVVGGFKMLIEDQRKLPGECLVSLIQFDHEYEVDYFNEPVTAPVCTDLDFRPRGTTALLDALGRGVTEFGQVLAQLPAPNRPGKVIVIVMTDGFENASKLWSREKVKALIEQQRADYNWEFVFTGANMDAVEEAQSVGIYCSAGFVADAGGVADNLQGISRGLGSYRSGGGYVDPAALKPDSDADSDSGS